MQHGYLPRAWLPPQEIRDLRRLVRYPSLTLLVIGLPLTFLLLFVYVFGGQLGNGLGGGLAGGHGGRAGYLNYVSPGIDVQSLCSPDFDFMTGRAIVLDGGRAIPTFPKLNLSMEPAP